MEQCRIEDCERVIYRNSGLCRRHHYRLITYGDPMAGGAIRNTEHTETCNVPGCNGEYVAKGLCSMHYARRREHGDPLYQEQFAKDQPCILRGCKELQIAKGYCGKHYQRHLIHGDPEKRLIAEVGKGTISSSGYRIMFRPGHPNAGKNGRIPEHRLIMSEMLGRPLYPDETVHHKNGAQLDNRPGNLELWVTNHQPGQRVEDLLAWAHEIIERYEGKIIPPRGQEA